MTYSQAIVMLRLQKRWMDSRAAVTDAFETNKASGDPTPIANIPRRLLDAMHHAEMDRELAGEAWGCSDIRDAEYVVVMGAT